LKADVLIRVYLRIALRVSPVFSLRYIHLISPKFS
jgi:hypothetical protein